MVVDILFTVSMANEKEARGEGRGGRKERGSERRRKDERGDKQRRQEVREQVRRKECRGNEKRQKERKEMRSKDQRGKDTKIKQGGKVRPNNYNLWKENQKKKKQGKRSKSPCKACNTHYGDLNDPKATEEWVKCDPCSAWFHESCGEENGICDDDGFICKDCV